MISLLRTERYLTVDQLRIDVMPMVFKHFTVEGNSGFDERYYSPALEPIGYLHANGRASKSGNRRLGISPDAARRRNARNRTKDKLVEVLCSCGPCGRGCQPWTLGGGSKPWWALFLQGKLGRLSTRSHAEQSLFMYPNLCRKAKYEDAEPRAGLLGGRCSPYLSWRMMRRSARRAANIA